MGRRLIKVVKVRTMRSKPTPQYGVAMPREIAEELKLDPKKYVAIYLDEESKEIIIKLLEV